MPIYVNVLNIWGCIATMLQLSSNLTSKISTFAGLVLLFCIKPVNRRRVARAGDASRFGGWPGLVMRPGSASDLGWRRLREETIQRETVGIEKAAVRRMPSSSFSE